MFSRRGLPAAEDFLRRPALGRAGVRRQTGEERFRENFHDRFLVVDDRDLYLIGASLKDLGKKCFGFTKMDPAEIAGLNARL